MSEMSPEYVQGSPEWLKLRKTKITATDSVAIMGVSPWKTPLQLYNDKMSDEPSKPANSAQKRGTDLEPIARDLFNLRTGLNMQPRVVVNDWLMASLDGINEAGEILEIKCPGQKDHLLALEGKIPEYYYPQLQHQMHVCNAQKLFYFSFDGVDGITVEVKRDDAYIEKMVEKEWEFYKCLQNKTPPDPSDKDIVYKQMEDERWEVCASQYKSLYEMIKSLEKEEEKLRKQLVFLSGESNVKGSGISLCQVKRKGTLDYAQMIKKLNVDKGFVEQFRNPPTTSWRITCQ